MLAEVISASYKASVTQVNFLILCSVKVAVQSWSRGCPPPKAPSLHLRVPNGVWLEVRVLFWSCPPWEFSEELCPRSHRLQAILKSFCRREEPRSEGRSALREQPGAAALGARERGGFPGGPAAPPAAGALPGSGTAASGISSGCEWLRERAGSGGGSGPGRPGSAMWEPQTAPGERRAKGAGPRVRRSRARKGVPALDGPRGGGDRGPAGRGSVRLPAAAAAASTRRLWPDRASAGAVA